MAISPISSAAALAATVTMPSHQAGDLLFMFAFRSGVTTPATVPAGWTTLQNVTGSNSCAAVAGYKIAASGAEVSGTWTNATGLVVDVYRGATSVAVDNYTRGVGSGTAITYPAITALDRNDTSSWIVRFVGHRATDSTLLASDVPSGYTNRGGTTTSRCKSCDTNGPVGSAPGTGSQTAGSSNGWEAHTYELIEGTYTPPSTNASRFFVSS